jgi:cytoskeletal protein RodZ
MNTQTIVWIVVAVLVILGLWWWWSSTQEPTTELTTGEVQGVVQSEVSVPADGDSQSETEVVEPVAE